MVGRRIASTLALATACWGLNLAVAAGPAFAATSVTPGAVTPAPNTAGATSTYTIPFTVATALPTGGTIVFVAPSETGFSATSSNYSIAVNNSHAAAVAAVAASPSSSPTNNQVIITLGNSTIAAGDKVTVTAAQTTNPQAASTTYTLHESTSADTTPAVSPDYTIASSAPASISVAQGSPQSAQISTAYKTPLGAKVVDTYGNPVPSTEVTFTAPSSGASGAFDATHCPGNTGTTPAYQCVVTTDATGLATAATFTANGTANSPTTTPYQVTATVPTASGTATTSPNNFMLTNTTAATPEVVGGAVSVTPSTEGNSAATYVVNLTTDSAIPNGDTVNLTAPSGTVFPASTCDPTGTLGCTPDDYTVQFGPSLFTDTITGVSVTNSDQVAITLGAATSSGNAVTKNTAVKITIKNVTNPTVASNAYTIKEFDQIDTTPVGSNAYAITPGPAASIEVVSGADQQTAIDTPFPAPLEAVAKDAHGNPVAEGTAVTFTLAANPTTAPSGYFPGSSSQQSVLTNAAGDATSPSITANNITGTWTAVAGINGGAETVNFPMANGTSTPASISVAQGSPQSAQINTAFNTPLGARVVDSFNNPVAGAVVTFTAPSSGASGTFDHTSCPNDTGSTPAYQCVVTTDATGLATAATFTANGTANSPTTTPYQVTATVPTASGTATTSPNNFMLTNTTAATPEVVGGAVSVTPSTEGNSAATYVVNLTTGSAIPNGDTVNLTAPSGTVFPASTCDPTGTLGCTPDDYTVQFGPSLFTDTITGVSVTNSDQVAITLGAATSSGNAVTKNTAVKITIKNVTNPTVASNSYTIKEFDQIDTTPVGSNAYAITPGPAASIAVVSGSNQKTSVNTAFPAPLEVVVKDAQGNPVPGVSVAFTLAPNPATAPSGYFPGSTSSQTIVTNTAGDATSSTITANSIGGMWTAVAGINSGAKTVNFSLDNLASAAASLVVDSGGGQTAAIGAPFAAPLVVTAKDANGAPVAGVTVFFATPSSGASATFAGANPHLVSATTDTSGQATSPAFTANGTVGTWTMAVAINSGPSTSAQESNTAGSASHLVAVQGSGESAHLATYFPKRLEAKVVDSSGNGVAGQPVTFSTPGFSHPTGVFVGKPFGSALSVTVQTGSNGIAVAPALLSSILPGSFQATAASTVGGVAQAVHFGLASTDGYWLGGSDGSVQTFGDAPFLGSMSGTKLVKPVVGMAGVPLGTGYWMVATDGGIFSFGPSAHFYGSMGGHHLNQPIVAIAATPDGKGYYMVASDGGIFAFGDAHFHGSMGGQHLNKPIVGMTVTGDGNGYWLVASDGGLFAFGDARFKGSMGGQPLNKPIVGMAATPGGQGYYLVASDGGIFAFGDAHFYGSTGNIALRQPIVGMVSTPTGEGYWFVAADGGVFNYGPEAKFYGSGSGVGEPVVAIAEG